MHYLLLVLVQSEPGSAGSRPPAPLPPCPPTHHRAACACCWPLAPTHWRRMVMATRHVTWRGRRGMSPASGCWRRRRAAPAPVPTEAAPAGGWRRAAQRGWLGYTSGAAMPVPLESLWGFAARLHGCARLFSSVQDSMFVFCLSIQTMGAHRQPAHVNVPSTRWRKQTHAAQPQHERARLLHRSERVSSLKVECLLEVTASFARGSAFQLLLCSYHEQTPRRRHRQGCNVGA